MHQYLVVANRTLGGPQLLEAIRDRMSRGPAEFWVLVQAQANLDTEVQRLREIGATVDGAVGDTDPMRAIEATLAGRQFDEILLSTLPPGMSRWLAWDLPHRVRRRTSVPVTVLKHPKSSPGTQTPS